MTMIKAPPVRQRQLPLDDSDLSAKWLNLAPFQLSKEQTLSKGQTEHPLTNLTSQWPFKVRSYYLYSTDEKVQTQTTSSVYPESTADPGA